ncbi:MAG TPA: hypothetical protein VKT32_10720 [Chthonomonadaceae bacterium]|nr:hypothetical protein [Chthonomonadaceae bacterium]
MERWLPPERPVSVSNAPLSPSADTEDLPLPRARDIKLVVTALILLAIALAFLLVSWPEALGSMTSP